MNTNKRASEYVQYGCAFCAPSEWRNFDASPTLRFERIPLIGQTYTKNRARFPPNVEYGDIIRGLPIRDNSCRGVYCSHTLEHLSLADFRRALKNTFRILKPKGIFRLVVPDLERLTKTYLADPSPDAASMFMKNSYLGQHSRPRNFKEFVTAFLGNATHLWMWDYKGIKQELEKAGFCCVRRATFGDSNDPKFTEVEDEGRWAGELGVECSVPE